MHQDPPAPVRFRARWGGWWTFVPRLLVLLALWLPVPVAVATLAIVQVVAVDMPEVPDLASLRPTFASRVETSDGWYLGGAEATTAVAYEALPPLFLGAVMAAEDEDFFVHHGFNLRAIVRAVIENRRRKATAQGASTITQQLAKRFVGDERTYTRKLQELLLARRLEATYSKSQILDAYLQVAYFGRRAYGVTQGSWRFFGVPPEQMTLNQMATLAGVLPAPSLYEPLGNPEAALRQRNRVLGRMAALGMISAEVARRESQAPLALVERPNIEAQRIPEALHSAIRALNERDEKLWGEGAMTAVMPHDPVRQHFAREALRVAVQGVDKRQGWRGPVTRVREREQVDKALGAQAPSTVMLARVSEVSGRLARVVTAGGPAELHLEDSRWAEPATTPRHYKHPVSLGDFGRALQPDDLVLVRPVQGKPGRLALEQWPAFEGAIVASDALTGTLHASAGAFDVDASTYNRAEQGCRQPGSVFKPIVYAEAINRGYTAGTMLSDNPQDFATGDGEMWRPRNADHDYRGFITLERALSLSRNIPTVYLMAELGFESIATLARRLGITSELESTSSMALGASCARPIEMGRVYSAFQRRGYTVAIPTVDHLRDAQGNVTEDFGHFTGPSRTLVQRLARLTSDHTPPAQALSEQIAYIMTELLRRVVTAGTAGSMPNMWPVAGKTGTSNEYDTWFAGFDGFQTIVTWVGSDKNLRPLGRGEHGATTALPMFEAYYGKVTAVSDPPRRYPQNPPPGVGYATIDPLTGLLTPAGSKGVGLPFLSGTAPSEYALPEGTRQSQESDALTHEF